MIDTKKLKSSLSNSFTKNNIVFVLNIVLHWLYAKPILKTCITNHTIWVISISSHRLNDVIFTCYAIYVERRSGSNRYWNIFWLISCTIKHFPNKTFINFETLDIFLYKNHNFISSEGNKRIYMRVCSKSTHHSF